MSWYQGVAGAKVTLSAATERRLGVVGFGVDDLGVIRRPQAIASLLKIGRRLKSLDNGDIEGFMGLEDGSVGQVRRAEGLGKRSLIALSEHIEERVKEAMAGMPGGDSTLYREFTLWAQQSNWEYPAGCLETDYGLCFCLVEDPCLSVFECGVSRIPGGIGDALVALADYLSIEAMKMPAHEAIGYCMAMGLEAGVMAHHSDIWSLREAEGGELLQWLEENAGEMYEEIGYWHPDAESREGVARQLRDVAIAQAQTAKRIRSVCGQGGKQGSEAKLEILAGIADAAKHEAEGELSLFCERACEVLVGIADRDNLSRFTEDRRFERMPGGNALVDFGMPIEGVEDSYQYLNEIAMNGEDLAMIPLEGGEDSAISLLEQISIAEHLLLGLGAMVEDQQRLS